MQFIVEAFDKEAEYPSKPHYLEAQGPGVAGWGVGAKSREAAKRFAENHAKELAGLLHKGGWWFMVRAVPVEGGAT